MIFKNLSDAATQLANKIKDENYSHLDLMYINPEAKQFADFVSQSLHQKDGLLVHPGNIPDNETLVIVDDGSTPGNEFDEFTNRIRQLHPTTRIILAIPIIPESEVKGLEKNCDSLLYLSAEPIFFSLKQFYSDTPLI